MTIPSAFRPAFYFALFAALTFFIYAAPAHAACNVTAGCTGQTSFSVGGFLFQGTDPLRLSASSSPTVGWITATSTTASSTFANGVNLTHGCFAINGTCIGSTGGSGTVTNIATTYPLLGGPITTTGTLSLAFGTTTSNLWSGVQTFTNAPVLSSLTGLLKGNGSSALTVAINGTDYTLITANTCSAGSHISAITAAGVISCTADSGGSLFPFTPTTHYGVAANSTSTPIWFTNGLMASTTNNFLAGLTVDSGSNSSLLINGESTTVGSALTISDITTSGNQYSALLNPSGASNANANTVPLTATFSLGGGTTGGFVFDTKAAGAPISFYTGGNSLTANFRAIITGAGNFGIGTTTPSSLFSVQGNSLFSGNIAAANVTATGTLTLSALTGTQCLQEISGVVSGTGSACGSGGGLTGTTGQVAYFSGTNNAVGTSSLFITPAGFVGVGTTSPSKIFTVEGNQSGGIARIQRDATGVTAGSIFGTYDVALNELGGGALVDQAGPSQTFGVMLNGSAENIYGDIAAIRSGSDTNGALVLHGYASGGEVASNALSIDGTSGILGIGTTTPGSQCSATVCIASNLLGAAGLNAIDGTTTPVRLLFNASKLANAAQFGTQSNDPLQFFTNNAFVGTFAANGNFGLATTTPGSVLSVGTTNGINFSTATSSFSSTGGINLNAGCFAVRSTCITGGAGSTPAGSNTQLQFNNSGAFGASSNLTYDGTTLQVSGSGLNNTVKVIGSNATSAGLYFQDTVASAQTVFYVDNDRGSFASYGGLLNGGSTNAIGNIFGQSRADHVFLFSDGANNTGLSIGTLTAQPLVFGTSNAEVGRFGSNGFFGVGTTTPGTLFSIGSSTSFINLNNVGTSTFSKGINLAAGCFAVNGICVGGSSGSLTGTTGQNAYFSGTNTAVGTSTIFTSTASKVGIGTTTPVAELTVNPPVNTSDALDVANSVGSTTFRSGTSDAVTDTFGIASSTGQNEFGVDSAGHNWTGGLTPTLTSCGGGTPAVTGDDNSGTITLGTGLTSACTLTFKSTWAQTPTCSASADAAGAAGEVTAISTTAVTFGVTVGNAGGKVYYTCRYHHT